MNKPMITVLMAVHNGGRYIGKAVQSIISQTFKDFEFLIIDDSSTDDSINIIKSFNDPRIKLFSNPMQMGLTKSLNYGISFAQGNYIARMDDDDISDPTRFQKQIDFFKKNPSYGLVGTNYRYIDEHGYPIFKEILPRTNQELKKALLRSNQFAHSAVMFSVQSIEAVGLYREIFTYAQDYDLFLRIADKFDIYNLPEILLELRVRLNSSSVKYRILQDKFANVALECSLERNKTGIDPIESGDTIFKQKHLSNNLRSPYMMPKFKQKNIMVHSYYFWANFFLRQKQHYSLSWYYSKKLLFKSFMANPFIFFILITKRITKSLKLKTMSIISKNKSRKYKEDK